MKKLIIYILLITFTTAMVIPPQARAQTILDLPAVGTMISPSQAFVPVLIDGLKIDPKNPFHFDFIVNNGETNLEGKKLNSVAKKLIKYFLTSLTIPEKDLWVNLSPYEKDRIIPESFGQTEMGRDLLALDYILKQMTASLMYPEKELGSEFWDKVYNQAQKKFGTSEIPTDTFNKVWIVPDKAVVYENNQTHTAYIVKSHLKVMLEKDYLAVQNRDTGDEARRTENQPRPADHKTSATNIASDIIRQIIIPALEKEVNTGEHFSNLRQITYSLILATWYKKRLKTTLLSKAFVDKNKTLGVEVKDKNIAQKIYNQYLRSFKTGVYDYIKEDFDPLSQQIIPRKYFSGGYDSAHLGKVLKTTNHFDKAQTAKKGKDFAMAVKFDPSRRLFLTKSVDRLKRLKSTLGSTADEKEGKGPEKGPEKKISRRKVLQFISIVAGISTLSLALPDSNILKYTIEKFADIFSKDMNPDVRLYGYMHKLPYESFPTTIDQMYTFFTNKKRREILESTWKDLPKVRKIIASAENDIDSLLVELSPEALPDIKKVKDLRKECDIMLKRIGENDGILTRNLILYFFGPIFYLRVYDPEIFNKKNDKKSGITTKMQIKGIDNDYLKETGAVYYNKFLELKREAENKGLYYQIYPVFKAINDYNERGLRSNTKETPEFKQLFDGKLALSSQEKSQVKNILGDTSLEDDNIFNHEEIFDIKLILKSLEGNEDDLNLVKNIVINAIKAYKFVFVFRNENFLNQIKKTKGNSLVLLGKLHIGAMKQSLEDRNPEGLTYKIEDRAMLTEIMTNLNYFYEKGYLQLLNSTPTKEEKLKKTIHAIEFEEDYYSSLKVLSQMETDDSANKSLYYYLEGVVYTKMMVAELAASDEENLFWKDLLKSALNSFQNAKTNNPNFILPYINMIVLNLFDDNTDAVEKMLEEASTIDTNFEELRFLILKMSFLFGLNDLGSTLKNNDKKIIKTFDIENIKTDPNLIKHHFNDILFIALMYRNIIGQYYSKIHEIRTYEFYVETALDLMEEALPYWEIIEKTNNDFTKIAKKVANNFREQLNKHGREIKSLKQSNGEGKNWPMLTVINGKKDIKSSQDDNAMMDVDGNKLALEKEFDSFKLETRANSKYSFWFLGLETGLLKIKVDAITEIDDAFFGSRLYIMRSKEGDHILFDMDVKGNIKNAYLKAGPKNSFGQTYLPKNDIRDTTFEGAFDALPEEAFSMIHDKIKPFFSSDYLLKDDKYAEFLTKTDLILDKKHVYFPLINHVYGIDNLKNDFVKNPVLRHQVRTLNKKILVANIGGIKIADTFAGAISSKGRTVFSLESLKEISEDKDKGLYHYLSKVVHELTHQKWKTLTKEEKTFLTEYFIKNHAALAQTIKSLSNYRHLDDKGTTNEIIAYIVKDLAEKDTFVYLPNYKDNVYKSENILISDLDILIKFGFLPESFRIPENMRSQKEISEEILKKIYLNQRDTNYDNAMQTNGKRITTDGKNDVGGIDLNPSHTDLQLKGNAIKFDMPFTEKNYKNVEFDGFVPVIINITPINNLPMYLGVNAEEGENLEVS